MALGSNIEYKLRAVFEAAFDEKSAKQVEQMYDKMSQRVAESSREEFISVFKEFGSTLNSALQKLNIQPINIDKLIELPNAQMFSQLGSEFGTKFAEGFKGAVSSGGGIDTAIRDQIKQLENQKAQLQQKQKTLPKRINKYEDLADISSAFEDEFHAFNKDELDKMGSDINKVARTMLDEFDISLKHLSEMEKGTREFNQALVDTFTRANDVFRMSRTLSKSPGLVSDKSLLSDYNFDSLQEIYNADEDDKSSLLHYDRSFRSLIEQQEKLLDAIPARIKKIDQQLIELQQTNPDVVNVKQAETGLKTLNEIEDAYKRILNAKGKVGKQGKYINEALSFDPSSSNRGIQGLYDDYTKLPANSPWEVEYQALLKYVKLYESYLNSDNKTHRNKTQNPEFKTLYEQLKPMAENAENMLRNVLNMADNLPLVGMDGNNVSSSDNKMEAEALHQAAGEAERKLKAEHEAAEIARQTTETAEKERLVREASLKASEEKVEALQKEKAVLEEIIAKQKLSPSVEHGGFYNSETGEFSAIQTGDEHELPRTMGDWQQASKKYDTGIHSHTYDVAVPSITGAENDFNAWIKVFDYIKKQTIKANKEVLSFDFSSLSKETLQSIAALYASAEKEIWKEFQGYIDNRLVGDKFGTLDNMTEAYQVKLKQALESIMQSYPGVMTSHQLPDDMVIDPKVQKANIRRTKLVDKLNSYGGDVSDVDTAKKNLEERERIFQMLQKEGLLTDEISAQYDEINQKLKARLEILRQSEEVSNIQKSDELNDGLEKIKKSTQGTSFDDIDTSASDVSSADLKATQEEAERLKKEKEVLVSQKNTLQNDLDRARSDFNEEIIKKEQQIAQEQERANKAEEDAEKLRQQLVKVQTTPKNIGNVDGKGINAEESQLKTLKETIETVTAAVNLKTKAFYNEGEVVGQVVGKEISALTKLQSQVKEVDDIVLKLVGNLKNVKTAAQTDIKVKVENVDDDKRPSSKPKDKASSTNKGELKQLEKQYEELGRLWARLDNDNYPTQSALIENLEDEIERKKVSLNLTDKEIAALEEKEKIARLAEVRLMQGEQEADEIKKTTEENLKFARSVKDLYGQYEKLGKLQAQADAGDLGKAEEAKQLEKVIQQEVEKLKLNEAQNAEILKSLQLRQREAKENKASVLAAKEQKKDEDKAWRDQVKAARGYTGVNAANSAVTAGNRTVSNVIGNESITSGIEAKARELQDAVKVLATLKDDVNRGIARGEEVDSDGLARQTARVKELTAEMNELLSIHQKYSGDNAEDINTDINSFENLGLDEYEQRLTKVAEASVNGRLQNVKFNAETKELTGTVKTGANAFTTYSFAVDKVDGKLKKLNQGTKKTETFLEGVTRKTKELAQYALGSISIYDVWNQIRKGVQYIKEIDSALVELKKVTDETETSYDRFLDTASKTSEVIGSTISDFTRATATFAKLGYDMNMASEMAEAAVVYQNVGDGIESADAAAESIISTIKGFNLEASESMAIVDRFNEIGNRFSIASKGIGDALQRSASALSASGNTLDESIGLITAANEVVQDPTSVGTALKTLSLRLRGAKTELEEAGLETENMAETTATLQKKLLALTGGKVDIMLDADTFKNSTQILREMSGAWEDMTDIQQAAALELMGGKRQANILSSIIQNFDTVESVIEASANSSNSALEENAKWMGSIEGRIAQFTNALQTMWNNMIGSDTVKTVIDLGTGLIKLVDQIGLLGTALLALSVFKGFKFLFQGADIISFIKNLTALTMGTKVFEAETRKTSLALLSETIQSKLASSALVEYAIKMGLATTADVAKMTTTQLLGLSFKSLGVAIWGTVKAIVAFLFTNPVGWAILATGAIVGTVAAFNHFHKSTEELKEELQNLKSELSNMQSELDSLNSDLETTQSRMAELLAMDSLTFTEQEELDNLRKTNDELQRKIDLLELENKYKNKEAANKFVEIRESDEGNPTGYTSSGKKTWIDRIGGGSDMSPKSISGEEYIEQQIEQYKKNQEEIARLEQEMIEAGGEDTSKGKRLLKNKKVYEKRNEKIEAYFTDKSSEWNKDIGDIEYFTGDDLEDWQIETNKWLDFINDTRDKWAMASGGKNAKSNAIKQIFNKEEFTDETEQINKYVESLKNGDASAKKNIENIINSNEGLKQALSRKSLNPQDAIDYFTQIGSNGAESLDELVEKIEQSKLILESLLNGSGSIKIGELFDVDGNVLQDKLSEIFKGTSETTRKNITSVLEGAYLQIKDGSVDIGHLLTQFGIKSSQEILDLIEQEVGGLQKLSEELDDIQSIYDTLTSAKKEYAENGYFSVDTLQSLLELEPKYLALLFNEQGQLNLNEQAILNVAQAKIQDMAITQQRAILENAVQLATSASRDEMFNYISATEQATAANENFVKSQLAVIKAKLQDRTVDHTVTVNGKTEIVKADLTQAEATQFYQGIEKQVNAVQYVAAKTISGLSKGGLSNGSKSGSNKDDDNRLDNLQKKYEGKISNLEKQKTWLENEIAREEEIGAGVSKAYYEEQIKLNDKLSEQYEKQRKDLIDLRKVYPEGSEKWYEVTEAIWETDHAIQDLTTDSIKASKSIIDLYTDAFEKIGEAFGDKSNISEKRIASMENYAELLDLRGGTATKGLYDAMIAEYDTQLATKWNQFNSQHEIYKALVATRDQYTPDSDDWIYYNQQVVATHANLMDVKEEIQGIEIAQEQKREEFKELATQRWDDVRTAYENRDKYYQNQIDLNDKYIEKLETLSINVPDEAYEAQVESLEAASASKWEQYLQARQEMIDYEGIYGADSQEYIDKYNETIELHHGYLDYENQILEKRQQIFDNQIDRFNQVIERITNATQRMQNISGLLEREDVATEDGEWTSEGLTRLGMAYQQMEYYKQSADEIADKMEEVEQAYKRGEISEKKYYETMQELENQQWDAINSYEDMKDSIIDMNEARIDMIEEGLDKEIEAYQELIDLKKEELDAERD